MDNDKKLFTDFPPVSREEWEKVIRQDLRGTDYKTKLNWQTGEGIEALPFYRRDDFESPPAPVLPKKNDWQIRQPVTEQDVSKANQIAKNAVENGADALEFLIKVRSSKGMLGGDLQGTAIQNQEAFSNLFDGIDLAETALHFDSGLASPILLAMLHNEVGALNADHSSVSGTMLFDPYAFIITNGQLPQGRTTFQDEAVQMVKFCEKKLPNVQCLGVDARVYHQAGATIVQEVGYALATGSEYLAVLSEKGIDINAAASAIHFNFAIGSNYFLEIAKFRAARKLWRKILDAYGADQNQKAYLHGSSSAWNKTIYDPYVNMLRTTTEGMSAAIAGCDAITLYPFDDTFRQPDDFSRRIARNSQIILKEEAYFNKVADPAAGSYYIEQLTDKIAEAAWNCFREVETQDGILKSMRGGYIQTAIEESRQKRDQAIASRERIFVGTNQYPSTDDVSRDEPELKQPTLSLEESENDADIKPNRLMASLKNAVKNGCSLGDLAPALFDLTKHNIRQIRLYRGAQAFEELRQITEEQEKTPKVLTLPMDDKKMRKARSAFTINFFGCIGYDIIDPIGFESVDDALAKIKEEQPDIVVLCSSDEKYEELVPDLCERLAKLDHQPISVLAGYPKEHVERYKAAGIDSFIHAKCNVLKTLKDFQKKLGVIKN